MVCAAYRMLKALASGFPLMQSKLLDDVARFIDHAQASLVVYDASPTDCINAIFLDNHSACVQASLHVCKSASMHVCTSASMQVCMSARLHV